MMVNTPDAIANLIVWSHTEFGGKPLDNDTGEAYCRGLLEKTRQYLLSESAAISANFNATFFYTTQKGRKSFKTVITIGLADENDKITYTETRAEKWPGKD